MKGRTDRRWRGEAAVLAGLALLLVGLALLAQPSLSHQEDQELLPRLSIHSSERYGARAIYLWLADLGYDVESIEGLPFAVGAGTRLLFVLSPSKSLSEADATKIAQWVERGGTLVVAVDGPDQLLKRLGADVAPPESAAEVAEAFLQQPVFLSPGITRVEAQATAALRSLEPDWVPLLGGAESGGQTVAAVRTLRAGRVFALSASYPLSNAGLGSADNSLLVWHILASVPRGSTVAFDEYHHGFTEHGTLGARLVREPWGWAILYSGGLLFAYVALRGRRFGRALPPPVAATRRTRREYVATLAGLLRRGGHRDWLAQQYASQAKRAIGARYRIQPDLPAREFVGALAARRPEASALVVPLARLEEGGKADEATVVGLVREVDAARARLLES